MFSLNRVQGATIKFTTLRMLILLKPCRLKMCLVDVWFLLSFYHFRIVQNYDIPSENRRLKSKFRNFNIHITASAVPEWVDVTKTPEMNQIRYRITSDDMWSDTLFFQLLPNHSDIIFPQSYHLSTKMDNIQGIRRSALSSL